MVQNIKTTIGEKNTKDIISQKLLEVMRKKGSLCDTVNLTKFNNYMSYTASKNGVSIIGNSIPKTNARYTAEHLDIGTVALIVIVACTHFYVVVNDDEEWDKFVDSYMMTLRNYI